MKRPAPFFALMMVLAAPARGPGQTNFYQVKNNVSTTLATGYTAGSGTLALTDASAFPTPTTTNPIRVTVVKADGSQLAIFRATGKTGNSLTGVAVFAAPSIDATGDVDFAAGSTVQMRPTAGTYTDIQTAINALETGASGGTVTSVGLSVPTGLSVAGSPVTTSGTLAISTSLSGVLKGTGTGFAAAVAGTDYYAPGSAVAAADAPKVEQLRTSLASGPARVANGAVVAQRLPGVDLGDLLAVPGTALLYDFDAAGISANDGATVATPFVDAAGVTWTFSGVNANQPAKFLNRFDPLGGQPVVHWRSGNTALAAVNFAGQNTTFVFVGYDTTLQDDGVHFGWGGDLNNNNGVGLAASGLQFRDQSGDASNVFHPNNDGTFNSVNSSSNQWYTQPENEPIVAIVSFGAANGSVWVNGTYKSNGFQKLANTTIQGCTLFGCGTGGGHPSRLYLARAFAINRALSATEQANLGQRLTVHYNPKQQLAADRAQDHLAILDGDSRTAAFGTNSRDFSPGAAFRRATTGLPMVVRTAGLTGIGHSTTGGNGWDFTANQYVGGTRKADLISFLGINDLANVGLAAAETNTTTYCANAKNKGVARIFHCTEIDSLANGQTRAALNIDAYNAWLLGTALPAGTFHYPVLLHLHPRVGIAGASGDSSGTFAAFQGDKTHLTNAGGQCVGEAIASYYRLCYWRELGLYRHKFFLGTTDATTTAWAYLPLTPSASSATVPRNGIYRLTVDATGVRTDAGTEEFRIKRTFLVRIDSGVASIVSGGNADDAVYRNAAVASTVDVSVGTTLVTVPSTYSLLQLQFKGEAAKTFAWTITLAIDANP